MSGPGARGADTRFGAAFFERAGLLRAALFFALPRGEDPRAALLRAGADVRDAMWRPYRPNPTSHGSHTRNTAKSATLGRASEYPSDRDRREPRQGLPLPTERP